jgi:hypothetical protein
MPEPANPAEKKVLDDVEHHGCHVVSVLEEGNLPPFAYTIGLFRNFNHAEVLVYGLPRERAHALLNNARDDVRAGQRFAVGQTYADLLKGYDCTFRAIPLSQYREHLGWAIWFYDGPEFPALQLVWPDREGRWPWQDGVTSGFRSQQLVLADAPESPPADGAA